MKKTNFTFRIFEKCFTTMMILAATLFSPSFVNACEMSCGGKQQVSLDENCQAEITAGMILSDGGASCDGAAFTVRAKLTLNGSPFASGPTVILDRTHIGKELVIEIESNDNGIINKCWGYIVLEDKLPPVIQCTDITVNCANISGLLPSFIGADCDQSPIINLIDQTEENLCDEDFLKIITRTYTATDKYNNTSLACTQTISVERFDVGSVIIPTNLRLSTNNPLVCDEAYTKLPNGNPDPSYTGVPYSNGQALYPPADFSCNTVVSFSDLVLPEVACVTKIMRTWVISEWVCGEDEVNSYVQIIEVVDNAGPVITPINDVTVSTTTGYNCQALYLLPQVKAVDNCKAIKRIDIAYPGGFVGSYDGSEIIKLPVGNNDITVTAYDGCLNSSTEYFTVHVADKTAPVAVCDQNTVVALSSEANGLTNVSAVSFDDGSYDECGLDRMEVRRMDFGAACGINNNAFGKYVSFCCSDLNQNTVVVFRVYDKANNYNDCMVNVEVQDKLPPTIVGPADMTVDCDFVYDNTTAGLINAFGDATFSDNCAGTLNRYVSVNINQCNTGYITRTFVASDANGSASTFQNIYFVNNDLFDGYYDIQWPGNTTLDACLSLTMGMATEDLPQVSPDVTGRPIISEDACDMVGADYDDRVFEIFNAQTASCFKIIRTWSVVDWCQTNPQTGRFLTWSWDQVIMVTNSVAPVLDLTCESITKCTFDGECNDGEVELHMSATDDCTPSSSLAWKYSIDLDNNGSFDIISNTIIGASVDASGAYKIGSHRIVWTVEDRCGNLTSCEQIFTVENCKTPTPYCYHGLAIDLMPVDNDNNGTTDGGMIEIWASDFDAGSFHQCGYDVTVSFSANREDISKAFDCSHIGKQDVNIWATAVLADGTVVQDYCTTYVDIQDNLNSCTQSSNRVYIGGSIVTENHESVEDVMVSLDNTDIQPRMTDTDGKYMFSNMITGGSYKVNPSKNSDLMNGVSTLDLVLIQRHILGLVQLDSPYKMVAADINNDKSISASDLLNLRKAILGINSSFENNDSWRFVDNKYAFIDSAHPLSEQFTEIYNIGDLTSNMDIDFMAVKVGDVNGSVIANKNVNAAVRSGNTLEFSLLDANLEAGQIVEIPIYANNFENIVAYQYSIQLSENLEFINVNKGTLDLTEANFGFQSANEGIVTTSWNSIKQVSLDKNEVLFTLKVKARNNTSLSEAINFNSSITKAEAYKEGALLDVSLNTRSNPNTVGTFKLYQNSPNPFNGITNIQFELPKSGLATFNVFDVTGKLVYSLQNEYNKGINNIELNVKNFGVSGVLYYTLQTEDNTATKKMVVLK